MHQHTPSLSRRLASYGLAAGAAAPVATADIKVQSDVIPLGFGLNNVTLDVACAALELEIIRFSSTSQFNTGFSSACCGYDYYSTKGGGGWSACTYYATYSYAYFNRTSFLDIDCQGGNTVGVMLGGLGDPVDWGVVGCNAQTNICTSGSNYSNSCNGSSESQWTNCDETRRFYVGFQASSKGDPIFGWLQIDADGSGDLQVTKWAYEDYGDPIAIGDEGETEPPAACNPDLNGDGVVDSADLGLLLGKWGPCDP